MLKIHALPALRDNYIWLIEHPKRRHCAVVDPGEAKPVWNWLSQHPDYQLTDILITHHHADHIGGVLELHQTTQARVIGSLQDNIPVRSVIACEKYPLEVLGHPWHVLEIPGHTLGHLAYFMDCSAARTPMLFSGDTLFSGGCGRVFEGTPEQLFQSVQRLGNLPPSTEVYCAHEYTEANLRFAQLIEPNNAQITRRLQAVSFLRVKQHITLPSTLGLEHQINPFLRVQHAEVRAAVALQYGLITTELTDQSTFVFLRDWKNRI